MPMAPACESALRKSAQMALLGARAAVPVIELWLDFWEAAVFVWGPATIAFLGVRYIVLTRMVRRRNPNS